jgi:hypothetical protein
MSNQDRVLGFLQSIAPADASNSEIVARTGITPHQQVFAITRELRQTGQIQGIQAGHEWRFWYGGVNRTNGPVSLRSGTHSPTATNSNETYDWDGAGSLDCRIGMTWVKLGRVLLDAGRLRFPKAPLQPGLYRFRIRGSASAALYIGETENLARRFLLYANPGASQQTNLRLNAKFREALSGDSQVAVAVMTTGAWIEFDGSREITDFSSKAMRRLFEHAAIVASAGEAVEPLNR